MPDLSIKPLRGICTDVNPLVAPPGSMAVATNVVFGKSGSLEPIHAVSTLATFANGDYVRRIIDYGTHLLVVWEDSGTLYTRWVRVSDGAVTTAQLPSSTNPTYETGRINGVKYRDRCYWTSKQGLICADSVSDTTLRKSGLPQPIIANPSGTGDRCNVCAVFRRNFSDNSFMRGPPSPVTQYSACSTRQNWSVRWTVGLEMVAGDVVEVYRTTSTTNSTLTSTTMYLCGAYTLTSTDITNRYATFVTHTPDAGLGEALYTNVGQQSAQRAYFPPPHLRDVVLHRGSMLGIAERYAHSIALRVPGRYGNLSTDDERTYGVGKRIITGQIVLGSPNITGVSASHSLGIVAGQRVSHVDFPSTTKVVSIAAGTLVCDQNATSDTYGGAAATDIVIYDILKIDSTELDCEQWFAASGTTNMLYQIWNSSLAINVTLSQVVSHDNATNDGLDIALSRHWAGVENVAFTVRATNGANWSPQLSWSSDTSSTVQAHGNRIAYSEADKPESWPLLNFFYVGDGDLVRLLHIGDAVYAFSTDGRIYRISGAGRSWRADQVADGYLPIASMAAIAAGDVGYIWTDKGVLRIGDGAIVNVSRGKINNALLEQYEDNADLTTPWTWDSTMAIDRYNGRLFLLDYRYVNLFDEEEGEWTLYTPPATFTQSDFCYSAHLVSVCYGAVVAEDTLGLRRFVAPSSNSREASVTITPNRTDLGAPGVAKTWDGVVLSFSFDTTGAAQSFSFTAHGDDDAGGGSVSAVTLSVTPVSGEGRNVPAPIGLAAGMVTQARFQLTAATQTLLWRLEDIVYRFTPRVDRVARNEP